ncbi:MAG: LytTR family transcriptional regulator [Sphingobacteriaceae bacterium]|nr:LytTR family transcriptional regulator [Sphingobacteriaceae bacterium]
MQLKADHFIHKIYLSEIKFIQSDDDYVKIHFIAAKPKLFRITLKELQAMLPEKEFIRIHRSYVLPIKAITRIGSKCAFVNELEFPVGSNYESDLKIKFNSNT